jgi:predicted ATPase/class 3 adenylate cyclase
MADVFLSYSSADRELTRGLDAELVAAGYTVYWDDMLLSGERFQEALTAQINAAIAVVVVWTPSSIRSDWVYSEARRGVDQHKLVQVRTRDLTINDLPAPFDAFHCPFLDDTDAVVRAVRSLAEPGDVVDLDARRGSAPLAALPTGTVTLLMAEAEASAQQIRDLGPAWLQILEQQREVCRSAWRGHRGRELKAESTSFSVVFATADDAVAAAVDAQRSLRTVAIPDDAQVGMRMGVHTGSPQRHEDGYVGLDVQKASRLAGAAHAGQVLMSEATARLISAEADLQLLDLGEHRFKDVAERIRVFQAVSAGLTSTFPPIRSQGTPGSLPKPLGPTVGRETELAELRAMLVEDQRRIVTLTGPGGTGKTRLATALATLVAEQFTDGVYLVPLQAATAADHVWTAMAQVLDIPPDGHIPPGFFGYVADRTTLVVLDNLEQVPDADEVVDVLLREAPHLTILATSRRPLHVAGEVEYAVSPLCLPSAGSSADEIGQAAAVQLFVEHASRVRKGFALTADNAVDVARLCEALDGLPLAIELAAARAKLLTPKAILARIDQSLDLASAERGRDERQRTIRAAIAWSYDLLEPAQQAVLDRLGIFESGASFEAVEAVVPPDALGSVDLADVLFELVDASLITVTDTEDGEPRFGLLQMIKRFALDRLAGAGTLDDAMAAHAQFFYDLARGPLLEQFDHSYRSGRDQFLLEVDNLRAVVERSAPGVHDAPYGGDPVPPLHVVRLLVNLAHKYRRYADGLAWCDTSLASPAATHDHLGRAAVHAMRARLHRALGNLSATLTDVAEARAALASAPADSDPPAAAWATRRRTEEFVGYDAGYAHSMLGDSDAARAEADGLRDLSHDDDGLELALDLAFLVAYYEEDFDRARAVVAELETLTRDSQSHASTRHNDLADMDLREGKPRAAQARLSRAAEEIIAVGDPDTLIIAALTFGAAIGDLDPLLCARVYGCAHHASVVEGIPNDEYGEAEDKLVMDRVRALTDGEAFDRAYEAGAGEDLVDLVRRMAAMPVPDE